MIRLATGGAPIGGGIGGTLFSLIGTMLVGLQPVVFLACGVYAGAVYGGIVGAMIGRAAARPGSGRRPLAHRLTKGAFPPFPVPA
jgi:hypothetical protein